MTFEGACIREQGITFGIIVVKPYVLHDKCEQQNMIRFGQMTFGSMPIVLMAQNNRGVPTYLGRPDIVRFLSKVHPSRIPWKKYTINPEVA